MYRLYIKRILDLLVAGTVFIILFPVFITIAAILYVINQGNPFFVQIRPGLNEELFKLYKFKTMTEAKDAEGLLLPDAVRLTPMGKILRKSSLDELPQLINVIVGDMSLIGPRPLLPRYLPHYSVKEKLRHKIRPGITGWAQVNGRNVSSWDARLAADVYYFENLSFILDMEILYKTFLSVISGKDVVIDPDSHMHPLDVERSTKESLPVR
ncbi:sugar transferase [Flavihumibacter sp. R14]|nr:sugar transferase [Flavihumibacter soli]